MVARSSSGARSRADRRSPLTISSGRAAIAPRSPDASRCSRDRRRRAAPPPRRGERRPPCPVRRRSRARDRVVPCARCARAEAAPRARCPGRSGCAAALTPSAACGGTPRSAKRREPAMIGTRAEIAAKLAPDETHRGIGADRGAVRHARCRHRDPRADRPRERGRPEALAASIARAYTPATGRVMPMPKIASTITSPSIAAASNGALRPPAAWKSSQARRASPASVDGRDERQHLRLDPPRARDTRADVAVAAVVAGPGRAR